MKILPAFGRGDGYRGTNLTLLKEYLLSDIDALVDLAVQNLLDLPERDILVADFPTEAWKRFLPRSSSTIQPLPSSLQFHWPGIYYMGDINSHLSPGYLLAYDSAYVEGLGDYIWFDTGAYIHSSIAGGRTLAEYLSTQLMPSLIDRARACKNSSIAGVIETDVHFMVLSDGENSRVLVGVRASRKELRALVKDRMQEQLLQGLA